MEAFWKWAQPGHRVMEAFGDENYVGIKEMTMDMKVWLRMEASSHGCDTVDCESVPLP